MNTYLLGLFKNNSNNFKIYFYFVTNLILYMNYNLLYEIQNNVCINWSLYLIE